MAGETRQRMIRVRVSEAEYQALRAKAREAGLSVSAFLRDHAGRAWVRHRGDERARLALVNRINANLNMIAKWVNTYQSAASAVQVLAYLADVRREVGRMLKAMERL